MQSRLQAQLGVLFDRESRDALTRRDPIEAGRLESIAEHLWETSGFDDDPFVDHGPITTRKISGFATIGPLAGGYMPPPSPPGSPSPVNLPGGTGAVPPRPVIPWGPVKPPAPAPAPKPAGPPCPKC